MTERKRAVYVCLALIGAIVALYGHLWQCDFIDFDDNTHVFENPNVRTGLSWAWLGRALADSGRPEEAASHLRIALAAAPNDESILDALRAVDPGATLPLAGPAPVDRENNAGASE